jgi:hypothetical protein
MSYCHDGGCQLRRAQGDEGRPDADTSRSGDSSTDRGCTGRRRPGDKRAELLADALEWQPDAAVPPLVIDFPAHFAEIFGEEARSSAGNAG